MKIVKNSLLITVSFILFGMQAAAQEQTELKANKTINNGYFEYLVADNEETTAKNYLAARKLFATQFPEKYAELVSEETRIADVKLKKHYIDPVEFDSMPDNKRAEILNNPDKYQLGPTE